ncbi:COG1669 Predicted nucleotidyltransferases [Burkholderiales bacterium]
MRSLRPEQIVLLKELAIRHGFTHLGVFGSFARGDDDESSDIDLIVSGVGHRGLSIGAFQMDAQQALNRKVDVVTRAGLHPSIRARILSEMVELS